MVYIHEWNTGPISENYCTSREEEERFIESFGRELCKGLRDYMEGIGDNFDSKVEECWANYRLRPYPEEELSERDRKRNKAIEDYIERKGGKEYLYAHSIASTLYCRIISMADERFQKDTGDLMGVLKERRDIVKELRCAVTNIKIILEEDGSLRYLTELLEYFFSVRWFWEELESQNYQRPFDYEDNKTGVYVSYEIREIKRRGKFAYHIKRDRGKHLEDENPEGVRIISSGFIPVCKFKEALALNYESFLL